MNGIQEWLSFYFKSPQHAPSVYPEHDLFIQQTKLKNTLRWLMGEEQITHLGRSTTRTTEPNQRVVGRVLPRPNAGVECGHENHLLGG